jgi:glutamate-1-semialdehyde 2,1-aminomutase
MIPAKRAFLQHLRAATRDQGILLVFDEIITQRLGPGGAQVTYGVMPDMTLLAKGIGGGFPIGAVGGPENLMEVFDNSELHPRVYHSGTFNANAVSVVAGLATLRALTPEVHRRLNRLGESCRERLNELFRAVNAPVQATGLGSLFNFHATTVPLSGYRDVQTVDTALQHQLFLGLLNSGIYCASRGMGCVSTPMGESEVDELVEAMARVLARLGYGR